MYLEITENPLIGQNNNPRYARGMPLVVPGGSLQKREQKSLKTPPHGSVLPFGDT